MVTYYVALPFVRRENGSMAPGQAVECPHSAAAIRRADAMSRSEMNAGAVAFSRGGSTELGEFDPAKLVNRALPRTRAILRSTRTCTRG